MVNSKDFNQDYNVYYRPSLNDTNDFIGPYQGMLPIYKFVNGRLVNPPASLNYLNNNDYDNYEINSILYLYYYFIFSILVLLLILKIYN